MSYIEKEPLIEFITKGLNNPDKTKAFGYDAIEILNEIEYAPTADVVPKSEVAREIFEEIEKHIQEKKKAISMFKDGEDDFYDGEIHALDVFEHFLAELKKKYTGGDS